MQVTVNDVEKIRSNYEIKIKNNEMALLLDKFVESKLGEEVDRRIAAGEELTDPPVA